MSKKHVLINGQPYDPITGLPVKRRVATQHYASQNSAQKTESSRGGAVSEIHKSPLQSSMTLNRRYVKRPTGHELARSAEARRSISTHSKVRKFADRPNSATAVHVRADRPAQNHPVAERVKVKRQSGTANSPAVRKQASVPPVTQITNPEPKLEYKPLEPKPASVLKNEAIHEAMEKIVEPSKPRRQKAKKSRWANWLSTVSVGLAVMLLGGYFTYLSMPNISIRMAAVQSGVDARYPSYQPSGYRMDGPIAFKDGEVKIKFAYVDGSQSYTLTQQKSDWNSSTVKEYVANKSQSQDTTVIDGLTIYMYNGNATWVNRGTLYEINSEAPLSNEQVQKIATSI